MNATQHFNDLYGAMDLSENDAARNVFVSGWNSALCELVVRLYRMPMEKDTKASFQLYVQNMMVIDPTDMK